jgi:hypothetical protein
MIVMRSPQYKEVYIIQKYYAPYEGQKYALKGNAGSCIATAFSKGDFTKIIEKYALVEYKNPGWEE